MAIEDNLDQLYALFVANNILCMRMWGYVAGLAARAEGLSAESFIERQRKMSIESAEMWRIEGHRNPDELRRMIKSQIDQAWAGLVTAPTSSSQIQ